MRSSARSRPLSICWSYLPPVFSSASCSALSSAWSLRCSPCSLSRAFFALSARPPKSMPCSSRLGWYDRRGTQQVQPRPVLLLVACGGGGYSAAESSATTSWAPHSAVATDAAGTTVPSGTVASAHRPLGSISDPLVPFDPQDVATPADRGHSSTRVRRGHRSLSAVTRFSRERPS